MWFDCILIDRIAITGDIESFHIRAADNKPIPVDRLEDIDSNYETENSFDVGAIRIYDHPTAHTSRIKTKTRNVAFDGNDFYVQLDHFGIPLNAGYYACVFPKGWRITEVKVYDPYSNKENPAENRPYRDVSFLWDPESQLSCTQFEMLSNRGTFSLGIIARLQKADSNTAFIERTSPLGVLFSDDRHQHHPLKQPYQESSEAVLENVKKADPRVDEMPAVNISLTGPSINIIAWGKYIANKIRRPKR